MDKAIFIPLIIWAIFVVVTALRKALPPAPRIIAVVVFVVYGFIYKDDIIMLSRMKKIPYIEFLKNSVEYVFISLAVIWPVVLVLSQNMTESEYSSVITKLAVFSALVFALFLYFQ